MKLLNPSLMSNKNLNGFLLFDSKNSNINHHCIVGFPLRKFHESMLTFYQLLSNQTIKGTSFALSLISNRIVGGILCIALCWQFPEKARSFELTNNLQMQGFLTQGYFLTSANRMFGKSDTGGGSFDYTEAGLTGSWQLSNDFRLAAQVLFRRAGAGHENDLELDFGLMDYTIFSTVDYRLGMRLGRFKNPFGFYNDTRDVLFTRPTILLPQSIYPDVTRQGTISADGGLIYGEYRDDWGNLSLELGIGYPRNKDLDTELAILGADFPGSISSNLSGIGRLSLDLRNGKYRIAVTSVYADNRYDSALPAPLDLGAGKVVFTPVIFSLQYNQEKFSFTTEYAIRPFSFTNFGEPFDQDITGESYYLQAEYRFQENWKAILRYDVMYNDRNDKSGKKFQAETGYPGYFQYAKTWTFGFRHSVNPSFLIAAEYHYVNGTAWLPIQDNPNFNDWEQRWSIFSLAASFRF